MKVCEILFLHQELLKRLHDFGIDSDDCKWVPLYEDYIRMKADGNKVTYIVAILSDKYNVCERKVYKIIRKMEKDCQIGTVV